MTEQQKKYAKWGVAALVIIIALVAIWYLMKPKTAALGNGNYGTYSDTIPAADYAAFTQALTTNFGSLGADWGNGVKAYEAQARGYFKGNNIAVNAANVSAFKTQLQQYFAANGKPHWSVTVGEYLQS